MENGETCYFQPSKSPKQGNNGISMRGILNNGRVNDEKANSLVMGHSPENSYLISQNGHRREDEDAGSQCDLDILFYFLSRQPSQLE